ncbi:MAG: rhomboid family intramembrane serine protease [Gammaproteobacteria bacterium]|nr:rhomboid family intramembrane serine protease [Gammaproteobacteria bacterium]
MAVTAICSIYLFIEHQFVVTHFNRLSERASFVIKVYKVGKVDFIFWVVALGTLAVFQYFLQSLTGGFEEAIYKAGLIYKSANSGEWWRLITGPYFHNGLPHWIINPAMILIIGPIIGTVSRTNGFQVFIIGNIIGAISALMYANLNLTDHDSYMGISGGILAMMG